MWISFTSIEPFMIKIYAGGVNAISGEHYAEDLATKFRRLRLRTQGYQIQDYVVTPSQLWLDGFATSPGIVKQFVAMPLGSGYTAEAQLVGQETLGGLQIEVTPSKLDPWKYEEPDLPVVTEGFYINYESPCGETRSLPCSADSTVWQIKCALFQEEGIPMIEQRLTTYAGLRLENGKSGVMQSFPRRITNDALRTNYCRLQRHQGTLSSLSTLFRILIPCQGSHFQLRLHLSGGGGFVDGMGFAAGGKIKQVIHRDGENPGLWNSDATMAIRVHIFNSQDFHQVTGKPPAASPVTAADYAEAGLPFYDMDEEVTEISGQFDMVKSVNEIEQERDLADGPEAGVKPSIVHLDKHGHAVQGSTENNFPCGKLDGTVELASSDELERLAKFNNPHGLINPAGPFRDFRCLSDLMSELSGLSLDDLEDWSSSEMPLVERNVRSGSSPIGGDWDQTHCDEWHTTAEE